MHRKTVALFLSTLALAGGTAACGHSPEAGEEGGDKQRPALSQPPAQVSPSQKGGEGGEGGEG